MIGLDEKTFLSNIEEHLIHIYPGQQKQIAQRILERVKQYLPEIKSTRSEQWSEQDVLLITYGDSIVDKSEHPLKTLDRFLNYYIANTFNIVHVLPFFPYSSDDGFSVIDYRQVNPELGDWEDIQRLSGDYRLMMDLVINHISRESLWFSDYIANELPAREYFIELPAETDTTKITRPRNSPLLVPVNTHRGVRHVWATFSADQIDLNFANPDVLLEMIDILLFYLQNGAKLIRLDAIAFLWKRLSTTCIHLKETHEVVKLIRDLFAYVDPECILLTETNVPHKENLSYFGDGDEAHMVYQFSLPPLVLHALNKGTARYLTEWAQGLPELHSGCTYLNFTASHDGVGLRALEGILSNHEVGDLVECMHRFGGFVSMKSNPNGEDSPYEVNISLFDAMQGTRRGLDQWQVDRFICSQAIMLGMQGVPAVYIHSILATPNDLHGVEITGRTRSINRKKWNYDELQALLDSHNTPNHEVFAQLKRIIAIRKSEPCFHPDVNQQCLDLSANIFAILRKAQTNTQQVVCLYNVTALSQTVTFNGVLEELQKMQWQDLVEGQQLKQGTMELSLRPYQFFWLKAISS